MMGRFERPCKMLGLASRVCTWETNINLPHLRLRVGGVPDKTAVVREPLVDNAHGCDGGNHARGHQSKASPGVGPPC